MSIDLDIKLKGKETFLQLKRKGLEFDKALVLGIRRAVLHVRSKLDKNLATGKFDIKTRTGRLRMSLATRVYASGKNVIGEVGTNLIYAKIQETGGRINVTRRMAAFAWHKWYDTGNTMWKAIALRKGRQITIPAHWFIRQTQKEEEPKVLSIIDKTIAAHLEK